MGSVLNKVDERTKLVGHNRLELLLFRLDGKQRFGINVFKVREVVRCPKLNHLPNANAAVIGVATLRGQTISVIDLQKAIIGKGIADPENASIIVAEYNRVTQGFLVNQVQHIVNKNWEEIAVPPAGAGKGHYLTAVTMEGNEIIEIIDVERVLHDVNGAAGEAGIEDPVSFDALDVSECYVLVADDSAVARSQIKRTLDRLGVKYVLTKDGREALDTLERWVETDADELKKLALVISDVEMPVMDGYTLTTRIKNNPQLQRLKVLLHTSLSGVFDSSLTEKVAADGYLSKFDSDELVATVGKFVATFLEKLK